MRSGTGTHAGTKKSSLLLFFRAPALALSFLLAALGHFEPFSFCGMVTAFFGYALFWKAVENVKRPFWVATIWFALLQGVFLSWMTAIEYQGIYILFVYLGLLLFLGLQWGMISFLVVARYSLWVVAALWTLFEWGRLKILCGFSFNPVGLNLAMNDFSLQLASVGGILGLSFWVMGTNLAVYRKRFSFALAGFVLPYLFGAFHIGLHKASQEEPIRVAIVQTGLLPSQKVPMKNRPLDFISHAVQWESIVQQVCKVGEVDYLFLPEAALPFGFSRNHKLCQQLSDTLGAEVIIGLDDGFYNAAFHFTPHSDHWERVEKQILLPLAEALPFPWLRPLTKCYGITDFFLPGMETKIFTGKVPMAVSICYEETFSSFVRKGRLKGGKVLVNLTNDGWYPGSTLGEEHFKHGKVRAVENGACLIRACNLGVSAVIDFLGRTISKKEVAGILTVSFVPDNYKTLYMFWGDSAILVLTLCILAFSLAQNIILGYPFRE